MADNPYTDANAAIIERCKKGDRRAFYEIYVLYSKAMFSISLRIVNNFAEAEEVLQDSFLKAFDKIGTYDPKYSFGAWLKRIVINGSLDALKKRRSILVPLDDVHIIQEENNEDEISFDIEIIKKCVTELPDGYRTILSLFVFEDYSHKQIAEMLGISEGTSKSQYNRAKKKLIELVTQKTIVNER
ncbi:MAG: polymerase [Bacteroidetes bacterium]|jgi:RNA polymerase sigma-70 factor (ECF subfamily)|nr:polymerase [Bacteroidota bacterium]